MEDVNRFAAVRLAAERRKMQMLPDAKMLARKIVDLAGGDKRIAYDYTDTLTAAVTAALRDAQQ